MHTETCLVSRSRTHPHLVLQLPSCFQRICLPPLCNKSQATIFLAASLPPNPPLSLFLPWHPWHLRIVLLCKFLLTRCIGIQDTRGECSSHHFPPKGKYEITFFTRPSLADSPVDCLLENGIWLLQESSEQERWPSDWLSWPLPPRVHLSW